MSDFYLIVELLYSLKSLVESCDKVVNVLDTDRETDSVRLYALVSELFSAEL